MGHSSILRTRISLEEILPRWQDYFGEGSSIVFSMGYRLRQPYLSLELAGEVCTPLLDGGEADEWNSILLTKLGLQPAIHMNKAEIASFLLWKSAAAILRCSCCSLLRQLSW